MFLLSTPKHKRKGVGGLKALQGLQDEFYMALALKEAAKAALIEEVPVGAVIVKNGRVIAKAHNLREKRGDATAHAELLAIQKACKRLGGWRLEDAELFVTLEPCPMCAGAILQARVKRLIFGASDPKAGAVGSLLNLLQDSRFNHQVEVKGGVCANESSRMLKEFFARKRGKERE